RPRHRVRRSPVPVACSSLELGAKPGHAFDVEAHLVIRRRGGRTENLLDPPGQVRSLAKAERADGARELVRLALSRPTAVLLERPNRRRAAGLLEDSDPSEDLASELRHRPSIPALRRSARSTLAGGRRTSIPSSSAIASGSA